MSSGVLAEERRPGEEAKQLAYSRFVHSVREEFDYVLLDRYPVGLVFDPAILAAQEVTVDARPRVDSSR